MTVAISPFDSDPNDTEVLPQWFVVYVMTRHEKRIADHFRLRQIEHFLPLYSTLRRWQDGTKVNLQLPLFPSYVFVRIAHNTRVRVLEVPGVLSLVGCGRHASPVPDLYIESLREGLRLHRIEPHPYLVIGARVRIKRGAMAGIEGVLLQKKSGFRVVLTLDLIMKSVSVEVDLDDVEPTAPQPRILPSLTAPAIA